MNSTNFVGDVASEANHARNKALQEQLNQLCDRIEAVLSKYTDANVEAATLHGWKKGCNPPTDRESSKSIEHPMPKLQRTALAKNESTMHVIVDPYGPEEQALG